MDLVTQPIIILTLVLVPLIRILVILMLVRVLLLLRALRAAAGVAGVRGDIMFRLFAVPDRLRNRFNRIRIIHTGDKLII